MPAEKTFARLFPFEIISKNLTSDENLALLEKTLRSRGIMCPLSTSPEKQRFYKAIEILSALPGWSNATEIEHLARHTALQIEPEVWCNGEYQDRMLVVSEEMVMTSIKAMFKTKSERFRGR